MPDCDEFLFGFKARQQAHSELCNCWRNAEAKQKDQQDSIFFDRNRLKARRRARGIATGANAAVVAETVVEKVSPGKIAVEWLERMLILDWRSVQPAAFAATMLGRRSGDRQRDLDGAFRARIT